jgi:hypothetical protein
MNRLRFPRNAIAATLGALALGTATAFALFALEAGMPGLAQAQDSHDGHDEGGCSGGGGCGGGSGGSGGKHGTRPGHTGHTSGVHGAGSEGDRASSPHGADSRRFGGGSGTASLDAVPEGPGRYGGTGAQGLRYWGGWNIPLGEDPTVVVLEQAPLGAGGGGAAMALSLSGPDRCDDVGGSLSAAKRIAGRNLERINGVHAMVVQPGVQADTVAPFLLANFQEELEKGDPDLRLAGVYLGTAASQPVTPELVQKAGAMLCVEIDAGEAAAIAAVAEDQRLGKTTVRVSATSKARP